MELVAPLATGLALGGAQALATQLFSPDMPDPPELLADASGSMARGVTEESMRRREASSQLLSMNTVGTPQARVGSPTVLLGGAA